MVCKDSFACFAIRLFAVIFDVMIIIGPMLGASLYDPVTQYPNTWLGRLKLLQTYPQLLPCALAGMFALSSTIVIWFFFEEVSLYCARVATTLSSTHHIFLR